MKRIFTFLVLCSAVLVTHAQGLHLRPTGQTAPSAPQLTLNRPTKTDATATTVANRRNDASDLRARLAALTESRNRSGRFHTLSDSLATDTDSTATDTETPVNICVTATGIDGKPAVGFYVHAANLEKTIYAEALTDENGRAELALPAEDSCRVWVTDTTLCYLPNLFLEKLGDEPLQLTASFEGYRHLSVETKINPEDTGYYVLGSLSWNAPNDEDDLRNFYPFYSYNGKFENSDGGDLYLPPGIVSALFRASDGNGHRADQYVSFDFPEDQEAIFCDFSGLQPVDFTLNGATEDFNHKVYALTENGYEQTEETLLPKGDYVVYYNAAYLFADYRALITDTVYFTVKDAPLAIDGSYDLDDFRKVDVKIVNIPEDVEYFAFDGFGWNGQDWPTSQPFKFMVKDNSYYFAITNVYKPTAWYFVLFNVAQTPLEVAGSPVRAEIDMEGYRLVTVALGLDAFVSDPETEFIIYVYDELGNYTYGASNKSDIYPWCLRTGTYHLRADLPDGRTCYAKFTVEADGPTEIEALFSEEPTAIGQIGADAALLDATVSDNSLTVRGNQGESIQTSLVDMSGRTVFSATAHPGETLSPAVPRGVYVVTLRQGARTTTKKVVI